MKLILLTLLLSYCSVVSAQTFNLTVNNGYGSGNYEAGDTVHVWSVEYDNSTTFGEWTGDHSFLLNPREWHSTLIMPNQNVSVTAQLITIPSYSIAYEQIMGDQNLKKVYYYFPTNPKGVIYFFNGTNGTALGWTDKVENRSLINAAITDNYGIIVTEAEEITLNTDLDNDGKISWHTFPVDTIGEVDYLNFIAIRDEFIARGEIDNSTPQFSVGMSAGGSFSSTISEVFQFDAGVSYCASSATPVFQQRLTPFAFRMARNDNHVEVGPVGNYEAWQHDSILEVRGICHDYQLIEKSPIYAERFARVPGISVSTSQNIFNELVLNSQLDSDNFALPSPTILNNIQLSPASYPIIMSLPLNQQLELLNQVGAANTEHKFYSDYNYETLKFFNEICEPTLHLQDIETNSSKIIAHPNPFTSSISLNKGDYFVMTNSVGQIIWEGKDIDDEDFSNLTNGLYFLTVLENQEQNVISIVKN